jgi:hypothetical protein
MKKVIYFIGLVYVLSGCATVPNIISPYPEPIDIEVFAKNISIEKSIGDSYQINTAEFIFPFEVIDIAVDTLEMKALSFARKSGENPVKKPGILTYYDLKSQKVVWSKNSFCWDPKFFIEDKIIIQGNGKVFAISKLNGEVLWERPGSYFLYNEEHKIGFTGSLAAFSLETGKDLWHRELSNKFGWDESKFIDSTLVVAVDGLHTFNLKSGQGWDFGMKTGKKNEGGAMAASIGLSVLSGLVGGGGVVVDAKVWSDMTSNLLYDNKFVFFSAKDEFVCVEIKTGKEVWHVTLPEKETAKTFIRFDNEHIVVVNTGSCLKEGKEIQYGKPFIAKYEKASGKQIFFNLLDVKSSVKDIFISPSGYYLISGETFTHYDLDGKEKVRLRYEGDEAIKKYGQFLFFTDDKDILSDNYINDAGIYKSLSGYYQNKLLPIAVTNKGLIIFSNEYKVENWFTKQQVFYPTIEANLNKLYRNYTYLRRNDADGDKTLLDVYLIDKQGNNNGVLPINLPVSNMNDFIYYKNKNTLTLISKNLL